MKWPWIGRLAYETILAERDSLRLDIGKLREDYSKLLDHVTRMDRVEHRLYEVPNPRTGKDAPVSPQSEKFPPDIDAYISGFAFKAMRGEMRREVRRLRHEGKTFEEIKRDIKTRRQPAEEVVRKR